MNTVRLFDLNIEEILESWDTAHAVRELIANAFDEQVLTATRTVEIWKDPKGAWIIRDYGRGLRYDHFTQNENPEKLAAAGKVIGKFGVGLKDAMAILDRSGVTVEIESEHCVVSLGQHPKHSFDDVVTLHAAVSPPRDAAFVGTAVRLQGLSDADIERAKGFFLKFSGEVVIEETRVGRILEKRGPTGRIYVAGLLIAEELNFAFSYDIISLTEAMKRALNRERINVGRTAYSERVKSMLLQAASPSVANVLADQLVALERGAGCDEIQWKDVAVHAGRILNASRAVLFVTASQMMENASTLNHARDDGIQIVTIPENIQAEVSGATDVAGTPMRDISVYQSEWNSSFQFNWVSLPDLTSRERENFDRVAEIAALIGGLPSHVEAVRVSTTMRQDFAAGTDALGLWDPQTSSIVIRRDQLGSLERFAGVLLHEVAHARSGYGDVTRQFENELTEFLGRAAAAALNFVTKPVEKSRRSWWRLLYGD
jgi:hypothetical protein